MTVKERRPACTPDRASAQALRPYCQQSQHTRTEDSPGERQRIGESIPLLWSMRNRPDQRRPRYPRGGKARGILYILNDPALAKIPPCTPFSTPLNFSPTQNPYITPLVIVLIFGFMIFRLRTRFLHVDHRTFLWISDFPAFILTGGFGKEIAVDYRTESLSYPYKE